MRWLIALTLAASGCTAGQVRDHTYPRGFEYLEPGELSSDMGQVASGLRAIAKELERPREETRVAVAAELEKMEAIAGRLDKGTITNHPDIDQNLPRFRERLAAARQAVLHDPPNYFLAGTVVGGCLYCH